MTLIERGNILEFVGEFCIKGLRVFHRFFQVHAFNIEESVFAVGFRIQAADDFGAIEYGQAVITEAAFCGRHLTFNLVIAVKQVLDAFALDDGIVEWRQQVH